MSKDSNIMAQVAAYGLAYDSARFAADIVRYGERREPADKSAVKFTIARMRRSLEHIERLVETEEEGNV